MKYQFLFLVAAATPIFAQPSPAKFNWKLRLHPGQTWTQTVTTQTRSRFNSTGAASPMKLDSLSTSTLVVKNQVLQTTPAFSTIRMTYTRFDVQTALKINGKTQPTPATLDLGRALKGASFIIKQAPDGHVLDVSGLETLVARQRKLFASLGKTPQIRAMLSKSLPSAASLRASIASLQGVALPKTLLAVGQSYAFATALPPLSFMPNSQTKGRRTLRTLRTLRALNARLATFNETSSFTTSAGKPIAAGGNKITTTMRGTMSGTSRVQVASGLPAGGTSSMRMSGTTTTVGANGQKTTMPISVTFKTTTTVAF